MRKFPSINVAAAISAPFLTALGCAEGGNKAYGVTDEQNLTQDQQRWVNQHSVDQKGHYNTILHQQALTQIRTTGQGAQ